jgi:hypothetical protein
LTMDHQFLEFWGKLWLQMAQGQKQWDGAMDFWRKGFVGFDEWNTFLGKMYGLKPTQPETPDNIKVWEETLRNFQKSFQDYFTLFGYVLRADYDRLKNEYDRLQEDHQLLKEKSERQEEAIRHLQAMLAAQAMDPAGLAKPLKDLISQQTEQFQRLMSGIITDAKKPSGGEDEGQ